MKLKNFIFILSIFFIGFTSAVGLCIDHTSPSTPLELTLTGGMDNLTLSWQESADTPICSGVDYYRIYKNGVLIEEVSLNEYQTFARFGTTEFNVVAVDYSGQTSEEASLRVTYSDESSRGGSSRSSGSSDNFEEICFNWTECVDGVQTQTCEYGPNSIIRARNCEVEEDEIIEGEINVTSSNEPEEETQNRGFFRATGGAITDVGEIIVSPEVGIPLAAFILLGGFFFVFARKKNRK